MSYITTLHLIDRNEMEEYLFQFLRNEDYQGLVNKLDTVNNYVDKNMFLNVLPNEVASIKDGSNSNPEFTVSIGWYIMLIAAHIRKCYALGPVNLTDFFAENKDLYSRYVFDFSVYDIPGMTYANDITVERGASIYIDADKVELLLSDLESNSEIANKFQEEYGPYYDLLLSIIKKAASEHKGIFEAIGLIEFQPLQPNAINAIIPSELCDSTGIQLYYELYMKNLEEQGINPEKIKTIEIDGR